MPIFVVNRGRFNVVGLPAGQRATPGSVGFLGDENALTLLNANDPLGDLAPHAEWISGELRINTDNFTLAGYKLTTTVHSVGATNFTVQDCVIDDQGNHIYGIFATELTCTVTVRDTTVRGVAEGDGSVGISATSNHVMCYRCDVSGFEDGWACGDSSVVDQCYGHNLDTAGVDPHNDVIQHYPGFGPGFAVTNSYLVQPLASSCLTFDTDNACVATNNYFEGGAFFVRFEGATNVTFTDNVFGPLAPGEFGYVTKSGPASFALWQNNVDYLDQPVNPP